MTHARIVETVTGTTTAELIRARDRSRAEMVELRTDGVADLDVAGVLAGRRVPVIFTCRAAWEGGRFEGAESDRLTLLGQAIRLGAEYVDVEWRADRRGLPAGPAGQLVLSHHDFSGTPTDLDDRIRAMAAERPDVLKISVTASSLADCVRLRRASALDRPHVAISMGPHGQVSRLFPAAFGSLWTYGGTAAPGQVSPDDLSTSFRVSAQTERTAVYGVAGQPLGHSASPAMHNAAFASLGMDAVYLPFETADVDDLFEAAREFNVRGLSITAPLKTSVARVTAAVDPIARATGAVNTLRRDCDAWEGRNYDAEGFLAPLRARLPEAARGRAVVVGAGGAARTAAFALREAGASVTISARRHDQAARLASELGVGVAAFPPAAPWDLLVNTTPVGTWPRVDESPIDRTAVGGRAVYDLIYNPAETRLLAWAREAGAETIGGLEMLVAQAGLQFTWWTGQPAPLDVMADAARTFIERGRGQS